MSTNAYIGIKQNDGAVKAIYVHWDGGLWDGGVGQILYRHYGEKEVNKLMIIGDISALYPTLEETESQAYAEDPIMEFTMEEWIGIFAARDQGDSYGYPEYLYLWDCERREWLVWSDKDSAQPLNAALESEKTRFALVA